MFQYKPKLTKERPIPARLRLINDIWDANQRLREYDEIFDNFKEGDRLIIFSNHVLYFTLESWDKEMGTVTGKYDFMDVRNVDGTFEYWEIHEYKQKEK